MADKPVIQKLFAVIGGTIVMLLMSFAQTVQHLVICRLLQGMLTGTVTASVALVAFLLLPSLHNAHIQSLNKNCATNLRKVGEAMVVFDDIHAAARESAGELGELTWRQAHGLDRGAQKGSLARAREPAQPTTTEARPCE